MLTAGIDLAAEPRGTALAVIDWGERSAQLSILRVGIQDSEIVDAAGAAQSIGIDCAFGWPDDFLAFVTAHTAGARVDRSIDEGMDWRRRLAYRETNRDVRRRTGRWPLSVATDRLGLTAMHCAALLDVLADRIGPIDRSGAGRVAEVYPSATLRGWGFTTRGYKTDPAPRRLLVEELERRAPWLDLAGNQELLVQSDDAFDAVIASLAARAHARGLTEPCPPEHLAQARREGWIALPSAPLEALAPRT
ncbi:MAG: hypothetical protein JWQ43_4095 [Glaciihabitans sp.]|nr:hypothetical protein [Glaciihabitans sp.]